MIGSHGVEDASEAGVRDDWGCSHRCDERWLSGWDGDRGACVASAAGSEVVPASPASRYYASTKYLVSKRRKEMERSNEGRGEGGRDRERNTLVERRHLAVGLRWAQSL